MAVPKRKMSRSRTRRRRASNWTTTAPAKSTCPQCQAVKLPHTVCNQCGWYGGRQAIEPEY